MLNRRQFFSGSCGPPHEKEEEVRAWQTARRSGGYLDFPDGNDALNRGYRWLVWAVLTAGLLLTGIVWNATRLQAGGETAERFAVVSNEARDAIESRVRGYSEILMGVRA